MRPASEIHSALEMVSSELKRQTHPEVVDHLAIVHDVLNWVMGATSAELLDGPNAWLVAYLMDDPPRLDGTPGEVN